MEWLDFYNVLFPSIHIFHMDDFTQEQFEESSFVIITTDDDAWFPMKCMNVSGAQEKVICYDHSVRIRKPQVQKHITTRPYDSMYIDRKYTPYMYPVYPVVPIDQKRTILMNETTINIAVVGGASNTNDFWVYLLENNTMTNIRIFLIHRDIPGGWDHTDEYVKSICPNTEIYKNCGVFCMMELLKRSHYIAFLTDIDKFVHHSCSGSVGLAFTTGCTMIMPRKYNTDFKFKNPVYFEDFPVLTRTPDLERLYEEQQSILDHNQMILNSFLPAATPIHTLSQSTS